MGHRIPLHSPASNTTLALHRQAMVAMARVIDPENAIVAGFRPQYMERQLVALGQADRSILERPRSERQKQKAKARQQFRELLRRHNGR